MLHSRIARLLYGAFVPGQPKPDEYAPGNSVDLDPNLPRWERHPALRAGRGESSSRLDWLGRRTPRA